MNIPVVTTWDGIDEIETDHPLYTGRAGGMEIVLEILRYKTVI